MGYYTSGCSKIKQECSPCGGTERSWGYILEQTETWQYCGLSTSKTSEGGAGSVICTGKIGKKSGICTGNIGKEIQLFVQVR